MNKEEIKQALEIIREPITVNSEMYHYFDDENYTNLVNVYENCLWFINNVEQIIETSNQLQERIDKAIERLNTLIEFWKKYNPIDNTMQVEQFKGVINILGGKE